MRVISIKTTRNNSINPVEGHHGPVEQVVDKHEASGDNPHQKKYWRNFCDKMQAISTVRRGHSTDGVGRDRTPFPLIVGNPSTIMKAMRVRSSDISPGNST